MTGYADLEAAVTAQRFRSAGRGICLHAGSRRELVEQSRLQQPDLKIDEERLPDMDSTGAVLKACGDRAVPVVVVTGRDSDPDRLQRERPQVMAVLVELVCPCDLIPVIPLAIQRFEQLQSLREQIALMRDETDRQTRMTGADDV